MTQRAWAGGVSRGLVVAIGAVVLMNSGGAPVAQAQVFPVGTTASLTFDDTRLAIFTGLANQIGQLPNPSGGGFTFKFDPTLGVFSRTTESFGPVFANRAETTGRRKVTLNASFSHHTFDEADGKNLEDGEIFPLFAQQVSTPIGQLLLFDLLQLREEVTADIFTLGAVYGVTDRIDVGIVIPILNVKVKERVREVGFFFCTLDVSTCLDPVPTGQDFKPNSVEETGLGDIVLRGKWNFLQVPEIWGGRMGVATTLDVKLPTGDEGDRRAFTDPAVFARNIDITQADISNQQFGLGDPPLGTGIFRVRPQIVASGSWSNLAPWLTLAPHVNLGVELGTTQGITNDFVYEVGVDATFFKRVTLSTDLLGRHAFDVDRTRVRNLVDSDFGEKANPDNFTLSVGLKANPIGTLLVFVNLLVAMDNTGIRDALTPTVGLEWSF
jgi:hypothetical protein